MQSQFIKASYVHVTYCHVFETFVVVTTTYTSLEDQTAFGAISIYEARETAEAILSRKENWNVLRPFGFNDFTELPMLPCRSCSVVKNTTERATAA